MPLLAKIAVMVIGQIRHLNAARPKNIGVGRRAAEAQAAGRGGRGIVQHAFQIDQRNIVRGKQGLQLFKRIRIAVLFNIALDGVVLLADQIIAAQHHIARAGQLDDLRLSHRRRHHHKQRQQRRPETCLLHAATSRFLLASVYHAAQQLSIPRRSGGGPSKSAAIRNALRAVRRAGRSEEN